MKIVIVKNDEGDKYIVKFNKKEIQGFLNLFESTKKVAFYEVKEGESILDSAKKQFMKNYNEKKFFKKKPKVEKYPIESIFKKFQVDTKIGGQCTLEQCSFLVSTCFNLFKIKFDDKFVFSISLFPYLECAISIIPSVTSEICFGFGPNLHINKSIENSFDIDVSGGVSVGVTLDFGIYFPSIHSPIRLSFNIGLVGLLGSGKAGFKFSLFYNDDEKYSIDLYTEFKAIELSFYVMFMLSFSLNLGIVKIDFSFSFYIYQKTFGGFKYEYHSIRNYEKKSDFIEKKIKIKRKSEWLNKPKKDKLL